MDSTEKKKIVEPGFVVQLVLELRSLCDTVALKALAELLI